MVRRPRKYHWLPVAQHQRMQCFRCMEQLPTNFNIHYKLPLIVGGTRVRENVEALCTECHLRKLRHDKRVARHVKHEYKFYMTCEVCGIGSFRDGQHFGCA